jgi:hypothetical protein
VHFFVGRAQKRAERERVLKEKLEQAKAERAQKWVGCNLYVRNLDVSIDDDALRKEFEPHGTVVSAKVSRDADSVSRGFGFVCFSTAEEATKAREAMNRKMLAGKPLYTTLWESKDARALRLTTQAQRFSAVGVPGVVGLGGMGMMGGGLGGRIGPNGVLLGPGGMGGPLASPAMGMGVGGMSPLMMLQPQLLANALLQGITANPQFAAMMRQMTPETMTQLMGQYMQNLTAMMRVQGLGGMGAMGAMGGVGMGGMPGLGGPMGQNLLHVTALFNRPEIASLLLQSLDRAADEQAE